MTLTSSAVLFLRYPAGKLAVRLLVSLPLVTGSENLDRVTGREEGGLATPFGLEEA